MSNYWQDRVIHQNEVNFRKSEAAARRKLAEAYKDTAKSITTDIAKLYDKLEKQVTIPQNIKVNDLYRNNQYYILLSQINKKLTALGEEEIKILDSAMLKMYSLTSSFVSNELNFAIGFDDSAREVLDMVWCPDGKHWSDRVWNNKSKMQANLEQGLIDCVSRGLPKDKIVTEIAEMTQTDRYMADRLARTELTFVQNEAAARTYQKAGIKKYEYLSAIDDRTSEKCKSANGQIFLFKDKKIGENFPPLHANCRCTILPIV